MPVDPNRVQAVFLVAVEEPDAAARAAYLDRECGTDVALRERVEALLAAHADAGSFLEPSSPTPTDLTSALAPDALRPAEMATGAHLPDGATATFGGASPVNRIAGLAAGTVIAGRYTLVEVIGEGGMGSVYLASQTEPVKRQVALKLIKTGMDTKAVLARFDAERQALALMDHPNIARIYDGGVTPSGQPFFVMELVHGVPITEYCDRQRLPVDARLQLFVAVCHAVQHAHQKGIIHRDLKPGNVLVTEVDGRPTPKVIDFGVAKATEQKLTDQSFADTGAIVGTPAYMSPEQADPSSMDIDTRTDVYALGVILYELLVGSPPLEAKQFKRGAILEMLRMVREVDPPRPSTRLSTADALPSIAANRHIEPAQLKRALRGDLDWIVMKSLEKDRTRRYDTANGFAADILRHLAYEPVLAAPPSRGYRLKKFVRKNRGAVIAASLVLLVLLGGIAGTTWGLIGAKRQEHEAKRQAQIARDETTEKETARAAAAAAAIEARRSAARADVVNNFLIRDLLAQADPRNNPVGDRVTVREILDRAAQAVARDPAIAANPEIEAPIRYLLGNVYLQLGRNAEAEPQLQRALTLNRDLYGLDNDRTLDTVNDLSAALRGLRKLDESRDLLNRTLAQTRRAPDDLKVLRLHSIMGLVHKDRGEFAEAEAVFRRCWEQTREIPGFDASERLKYLANLAWILVAGGDRKKVAEAYQLIHDRLDEFPRVWGSESRDVYAVLDTLGGAARLLGRTGEAVKWHRQAWQGRKHVLGEDNEETLASMNNLALALLDDGKPVEAEPLFQRAAEAAWPPGEGGVRSRATAQFNLGLTLKVQEKWAEAAGPMRDALKVYRRQSGLANPETSMIAATLLDVLAARGRTEDWEESERLLVELLPPIRKAFAPDSNEVIDVLNRLGQARLWLRKYEAAETPLREVLAIREKKNANIWTTFNSQSLVGEALTGQMRYAEAEPLLMEGYRGMKARAALIPQPALVRLPEAVDRLVWLCSASKREDEKLTWQTERAMYPLQQAPPPRTKP